MPAQNPSASVPEGTCDLSNAAMIFLYLFILYKTDSFTFAILGIGPMALLADQLCWRR